jgi:uncharacterized lipoprotein YddW (UPF0748 family)
VNGEASRCLALLTLIGILSAPAAGAESLAIDAFDYATLEEARAAWRPSAGSDEIELMPRDGGRAGAFRIDLGRVEKRAYYDRRVKLDLSRFGRVSLFVYADKPGCLRVANIYFESGRGWYSGSFAISRKGWQQVTIDRTDFGVEGSPAGWHKIEAIRLAFWKAPSSSGQTVTVAVDEIEAHSAPLVIVRGDLTAAREASTVRSIRLYSANLVKLLRGIGLDCVVVDEADLTRGALAGAKLAVFPYNPEMSPRHVEAVSRFMAAGGNIMLFYCLPKGLADLLDIADAGWMRQKHPGQFATVRLDGRVIAGAPESIQQGSWNIRRPGRLGSKSRIAGEWVDAHGRPTGIPAVIISPRGMYMGHVLTPGDDRAKRKFMLASMAAIVLAWKPKLAKMSLARAGRVGDLGGIAEVRRFVESRRSGLPEERLREAIEALDRAERTVQAAAEELEKNASGSFASVLEASQKAQSLVEEAVHLSFPSWRPGFRAVWCHSAFGIPGWSWDRAIRHLKSHGFNAIVVNMLWAGVAYYRSEVLPVAGELGDRGDQLADCLAACRKHGLELHVWKVNFNLSRAPQAFVGRMRREGRLQADRSGREVLWLSPSHPENFKLERDSMLEVVRRYAVDGIHFDYIRYPNSRADYSAGARRRFEKSSGVEIERWPEDVISGPHAAAFAQWRRGQITRLVREVAARAREIRPGVKISAAVFKNYPRCRESVGQDWASWVRSGYLDFVCPMNYTASESEFQRSLDHQLDLVGGKAGVYPGIGVTASSSRLSPFQTLRQLMIARRLGAKGFVLFNYGPCLANEHIPALRKGLLAE